MTETLQNPKEHTQKAEVIDHETQYFVAHHGKYVTMIQTGLREVRNPNTLTGEYPTFDEHNNPTEDHYVQMRSIWPSGMSDESEPVYDVAWIKHSLLSAEIQETIMADAGIEHAETFDNRQMSLEKRMKAVGSASLRAVM
ncbi:MAG: hypothetical protein ACHQTE_01755 [Candidatus Saccharimonadales bacterium]